MRIYQKVFLLLVSIAIVSGIQHIAVAETIHAGITEWPPYLIYDGTEVKGIIIDILQEVSVRTGYSIVYHQLPQKRVYDYFMKGTITLEPGSNPAWRKEFEDISCYSIPYYKVTTIILGKKSRQINATCPEDFRGKVLGGDLGFSGYGDGFDEAFANGTIRREDVTTGARGNIQKLVSNRVDGILIDRLVAWHTIKTLGLNPDDFQEMYRFKVVEYLFLRFHKNQEVLLPKVNAALKAMQSEGIIEKITENYK
ncbi:MAG: transporter substrate-binding domain-containing protein [Desulfobacterales bacterium]|nr:transporter substrate-binding domain-containing protein [Desulfobacterales bacterium]